MQEVRSTESCIGEAVALVPSNGPMPSATRRGPTTLDKNKVTIIYIVLYYLLELHIQPQ